MRKLIVSLLTVSGLILGMATVQAQPNCQNLNIANPMGSFVGTFCIDLTASPITITLDGTAKVAKTGNSYGVVADATVSGTPGNYTTAGSVTISLPDGSTKTFTFACSAPTPLMAETAFVGKTINTALSQLPPPKTVHPFRAPIAPTVGLQ
jgi:hypothetical protein